MNFDLFTEPGAEIHKSASLSDCGRYRYWLGRWWSEGPRLNFIMLNPSTADAEVDDPTIRRCMGFARREGLAGITVCNLFAFRATKPEALKTADDPVGPLNLTWLAELLAMSGPVVAAWGVHGSLRGQGEVVRRMARAAGVDLHHLGLTKDGHPKHPLYLKSAQPLERWP